MTIAIFALVFIEVIALTYFGLAILEIRDKMNSTYPELVKLMAEQNKLLHNNLDILNKWADTTADLIAHVERIEDLEGDIKDIFEWIHSIDDNVAGMRKDIQRVMEKVTILERYHDLVKDNIDGDIPTSIISRRGNYRQFLSSSDKDVNALYEEIADRSMKKYETILKEKDPEGDDNA